MNSVNIVLIRGAIFSTILFMRKPIAVLDTNVIFSGLYSSDGASYQILKALAKRLFDPVLSVTLLFEYEDVLRRNAKMLGLDNRQIESILDNICDFYRHQKIHFRWRPNLKDPKDDHVLELAVAANANFIVTHNIRDFKSSNRFSVKVVSPKQFLEKI